MGKARFPQGIPLGESPTSQNFSALRVSEGFLTRLKFSEPWIRWNDLSQVSADPAEENRILNPPFLQFNYSLEIGPSPRITFGRHSRDRCWTGVSNRPIVHFIEKQSGRLLGTSDIEVSSQAEDSGRQVRDAWGRNSGTLHSTTH
jgi:hypothetical protein